MSNEDVYDKLKEHLGDWVLGMPESEYLKPLLKLRFTPEEAELLSQLPFLVYSVEQLSSKIGIPKGDLKDILETLAKKGVVFRVDSSSGVLYSLTDSLFTFYRSIGWKGEDNDFTREISPYLNKYYVDAYANEFMGHETKGLRAIPINETIQDTRQVMPYEDILKVIDNFKYYSVSTCPCSHRHNLDLDYEECEHDLERCLHFDTLGKYCVENGLGREITKEETLEILKRAADTGLVHGISNTEGRMDTICNCCSCCCLFLESAVKMSGVLPRGHQPSNYLRGIDEEKCIGCGICVKSCPMNALELVEKKVIFEPERCIGCGVCAHKCKQDATFLEHREEDQNFSKDPRELGTRLLNERGRDPLKTFTKNMIN